MTLAIWYAIAGIVLAALCGLFLGWMSSAVARAGQSIAIPALLVTAYRSQVDAAVERYLDSEAWT